MPDDSGRRMQAAVIAQFFASHVLAFALVWILVMREQVAALPRVLFALAAVGLLGVVLTFNVQRAVRLTHQAIVRLNRTLNAPELRTLRIDPLSQLLNQVNTLARRDVGNLREALLMQTREAAAQEERKRLARDLHDSIKQQLFSINVSAAAVNERWEKDPAGAQSALLDVRQSTKEAMVEMDVLLQQLSPVPLEKVGLVQTLREQAEALGYRTGAEVEVEIGDLPPDERLPVGAQEAIFRVIQEALSNIARHSRAQRVTLRLQQQGEKLCLEVVDDGQGFTPGKATSGMGLANMRTRMRNLDGRLAINSSPGKGTQVDAWIPLTDTLQEEAMDKIDHTYNKMFLTGIVGGILVALALIVPLYVLLPGQYVDNWPQAPALLGPVCWLIATVLTIGTGYLASRWAKAGSRWQSALIGTLAGCIAALVAFIGIGAAAAGVLGISPILEWGYRPARDHQQLLQIGLNSTLGAFVWNYRVLWAGVFAGIGLGALGGLIAERRQSQPDPDNLLRGARLLLNLGVAGASMVLTVHFPLLIRAEEVVEHVWRIVADAQGSDVLAFVPQTLTLWPIGSTLVAFIAMLAIRYAIQRADAHSEIVERLAIARTSGVLLAAWSPILMAFLVWIAPETLTSIALRPLLLIGLAVSMLLSVLYALEALRAGRRLHAMGLARRMPLQVGGTVLALLIFAVFVVLLLLPGMNGWARSTSLGIYHSALMQLDITISPERFPYFLPIGVLPYSTEDNWFISDFAWFDQWAGLKTVVGLAGIVLAHWLLKITTVGKTGAVPLLGRRQFLRTMAGSLLGLILIISLATTLPGTAATTLFNLVFSSTGVDMYRDLGDVADPYAFGSEHIQVMPLWPLSYYGEDVTEPPLPYKREELAEIAQTTGQSVDEFIVQMNHQNSPEVRLSRNYTQQFYLPVAYPIIMLVLSGVIWLVVAGIDALAWRRARELAQQMAEEEKSPAAS